MGLAVKRAQAALPGQEGLGRCLAVAHSPLEVSDAVDVPDGRARCAQAFDGHDQHTFAGFAAGVEDFDQAVAGPGQEQHDPDGDDRDQVVGHDHPHPAPAVEGGSGQRRDQEAGGE